MSAYFDADWLERQVRGLRGLAEVSRLVAA